MCLLRIHLPNLCPNMNHFDSVDFSECHSEEVISFFWRSVYVYQALARAYLKSNLWKLWCSMHVFSLPRISCQKTCQNRLTEIQKRRAIPERCRETQIRHRTQNISGQPCTTRISKGGPHKFECGSATFCKFGKRIGKTAWFFVRVYIFRVYWWAAKHFLCEIMNIRLFSLDNQREFS